MKNALQVQVWCFDVFIFLSKRIIYANKSNKTLKINLTDLNLVVFCSEIRITLCGPFYLRDTLNFQPTLQDRL